MTLKLTWLDQGRRAKNPADPRYPDGIPLDASNPAKPWCGTAFTYPAPGVGKWIVECDECGLRALISAAGRPDDPRSLKIACKPH